MNFASQEYNNPLQEYETNYEDDFQDEVEWVDSVEQWEVSWVPLWVLWAKPCEMARWHGWRIQWRNGRSHGRRH
jgi:hypothetical protein